MLILQVFNIVFEKIEAAAGQWRLMKQTRQLGGYRRKSNLYASKYWSLNQRITDIFASFKQNFVPHRRRLFMCFNQTHEL
jgi:hypothetical protein